MNTIDQLDFAFYVVDIIFLTLSLLEICIKLLALGAPALAGAASSVFPLLSLWLPPSPCRSGALTASLAR